MSTKPLRRISGIQIEANGSGNFTSELFEVDENDEAIVPAVSGDRIYFSSNQKPLIIVKDQSRVVLRFPGIGTYNVMDNAKPDDVLQLQGDPYTNDVESLAPAIFALLNPEETP